MGAEQRTELRRRTLLSGKILFSGHWSTMDCSVRNLSSGGALLKLAGITELPDTFDLLLPEKRILYAATKAWQSGAEIGVQFTGEARRLTGPELRSLCPA